jgi:hypothetical protein
VTGPPAHTLTRSAGSRTIHSLVIEHDHGVAHRIWRANDPDAGILVAGIAPDFRRPYDLWREVFIALGKDPEVSGAGRDSELDWALLPAWFLAHRIRHLVLINAERLPAKHLLDVSGLAAVGNVELWLVAFEPVATTYERAIETWPTSTVTLEDLVGVLEELDEPGRADVPLDFPRVPLDNFMTFLADARRELSAGEFQVVGELFRFSVEGARQWFREANDTVCEESVLGYLRRLLRTCATTDEVTVVVRGIQVAAFHEGWLVNADIARLIATADQASRAAVTSTLTWRRLLAYKEPYRGAACALAAADLSVDEMLTIRCMDVDEAGHSVQLSRGSSAETIEVPVGAGVLLRAQRIYREHQGAHPDEPFFGLENEPLERRYLAAAMRAPILELGVPLYSQRVMVSPLSTVHWGARWGLSVQELAK